MIFESNYDERYWKAIQQRINNEMGTAALMGNLYAESGLIPYRKQGDMSPPYTASQEYTNSVDSGSISESTFVNDSIGYGLAQWTYYTRKQRLYDLHISNKMDIGSFDLSLIMLFAELTSGYPTVLEALVSASDIRTASDYVLHNYEQPEDQSEAEEEKRYGYALNFYNEYKDTPIDPEPPIGEHKKMPLWFYLLRRVI